MDDILRKDGLSKMCVCVLFSTLSHIDLVWTSSNSLQHELSENLHVNDDA